MPDAVVLALECGHCCELTAIPRSREAPPRCTACGQPFTNLAALLDALSRAEAALASDAAAMQAITSALAQWRKATGRDALRHLLDTHADPPV